MKSGSLAPSHDDFILIPVHPSQREPRRAKPAAAPIF